jgi:predicted flap endonuclease-1-like 5' DNA nuclease
MADHQELDRLQARIQEYVQRNISAREKRQELDRKIEDLFDKIRSTLEGTTSAYEAWIKKHIEDMRVTPGVKVRGITLKKIEGIGGASAQKLKKLGVTSTQKLLNVGASPKGRQALAEEVGIDWVNLADLVRIKGVGEEYTDLLEQAGVDTVPELAQRNPANLHLKILEVNQQKRLVRRPPSQAEVEDWVAQAKELPRVINY